MSIKLHVYVRHNIILHIIIREIKVLFTINDFLAYLHIETPPGNALNSIGYLSAATRAFSTFVLPVLGISNKINN